MGIEIRPMQDQFSTHQLLLDPQRIPMEQLVSEFKGHQWKARTMTDLRDYACHPAAILSDESYSVFVKFSDAANGLEQFDIELAGLRLLRDHAGVFIPTLIGNIPVEGGSLMVLEAVQAVDRGPRQWREIGRTLARIHQIKGEQYGLDSQGYFGPLYQDNRPMANWASFYAERRLWPRLMGAIDSGNLPSFAIRQIEKLIARLPDLCGPETTPTLLHGDAQQNNFISANEGTFVIDPAVYYGNPEIDLAYIDYFQSVPDEVFLGYQEELPINPGFHERRDLWRVYGYLAAVTVEGPAYLGMLMDAVEKYL
jgi:protein-ribulosamine 3-kinase